MPAKFKGLNETPFRCVAVGLGGREEQLALHAE